MSEWDLNEVLLDKTTKSTASAFDVGPRVSRADSHEEGQKKGEGGKWTRPELLYLFHMIKESKDNLEPPGPYTAVSHHVFSQ